MKDLTLEWIQEAEEDYLVAEREYRVEPPAYNSVCFHAQQCIEKYMKELIELSSFAVEIRYPGIRATVEEAKEAITIRKKIRKIIKEYFKTS